MARPNKRGVDYFSHDVSHGKTLFVLEQKWGNDGYAVWFKLLEGLAAKDDHCLDFKDDACLLHLSSKCHISEGKLVEIVNAISKMGAIDPELWETERLVWCQGLVDRLEDVYKRRKCNKPVKPGLCLHKPPREEVNAEETPQSKVNESKEKKTTTTPVVAEDLQKVKEWYSDCFRNFMPSKTVMDSLKELVAEYPLPRIHESFTAASSGHKTFMWAVNRLKNISAREDAEEEAARKAREEAEDKKRGHDAALRRFLGPDVTPEEVGMA